MCAAGVPTSLPDAIRLGAGDVARRVRRIGYALPAMGGSGPSGEIHAAPCVLLASDGSDAALVAEQWLVAAHWRRPPMIDVVSVAQRAITRLGWSIDLSRVAVQKAIESIREGELLAAQRIANEVGARLQGQGLAVRTWARTGDVVDEIQVMTDELRPCLVVVGPRGRSGFVEALLGSVTMQLVDQCDSPVLVARDVPPLARGNRPAHVALIVDSEAAARTALEQLAELGWHQAERLTLVGLTGIVPGVAADDPRLTAEVGELLRHEVVAILGQLARSLPAGTTTPELDVQSGHPVRAGIDSISALGADLAVVVRPPRRRGIDPYVTKIARHAPSSVMVVPTR